MKVAIAARNLRGKTGVSAIALEQIARLARRGDEPHLIGERIDSGKIQAAGGTSVKLRRLPGPRAAARRFYSWRVDRLVAKGNYDLVIGNSEILHQDVLFVHNLTHMEYERVPTSNDSGLRSKMNFDSRLFATGSFRICVANSELTREYLIARHGLNPETLTVIHPGYDPDVFARQERAQVRADLRQEICPDDALLIGFITSGHFEKRGADILVDTLQQLDQNLIKQLRILAVGSKGNTDKLRAQLVERGIGDCLITRDKTDAIARYYHAIDLLFYPARMEEFGLVVLEAAACGTPILTSRQVGAAELLGDDARAITESPSAGAFAPMLRALIEMPEQLAELADNQHKRIKDFTWDRYFDRVFSLYDDLHI